jgi:hypothetical protein
LDTGIAMLYHSFPRSRIDNPADKGIKILENILKYGLLLVPEILKYPVIKDMDENEICEYNLIQCRLSMTALDNSQMLEKHAEIFGNIHLEFTTENAYEIGAIPVIYVPKAAKGAEPNSLWHLAASLIHRLSDLKKIAAMLEYLDKAAYQYADEKEITASSESGLTKDLLVKQLRDTLELILEGTVHIHKDKNSKEERNYNDIEFSQIQGAIQCLCSLFYTTDNEHLTKDEEKFLYYFRQREWRIAPGMSIKGAIQDEEIVPKCYVNAKMLEIRNAIIDVDEDFFTKELDFYFSGRRYQRIDLCRILRKINKTDDKKVKPIQEYINKIIVPDELYDKVLGIAEKNRFHKEKIVRSTEFYEKKEKSG